MRRDEKIKEKLRQFKKMKEIEIGWEKKEKAKKIKKKMRRCKKI